MGEPDRINYTFGFKKNIGNYQTAMVNVSYSSDVKDGENVDKAHERVVKFVEEKVEKKWNSLETIDDLKDIGLTEDWQE